MAIESDSHKVGLIPVTLMVSGNIMGSGVFLLPANLASTGGVAIYGWLVTIIGALALSMVYAKMSSLDASPGGSYAYARRAFGPFIGYQTNLLYWLACWVGNIAMVVIGVGYLSYFFPALKDPMIMTLTCVLVLWFFVILNIIGAKMITRVQAVATVLALVPILSVAILAGSGLAAIPIWPRGTSAEKYVGRNSKHSKRNAMVIYRRRERVRCRRRCQKPEEKRPDRHYRWCSDCRRLLCALNHRHHGYDPECGIACINIPVR